MVPKHEPEPSTGTLADESSDRAPCLHDGEEVMSELDGGVSIACCEGLAPVPVYKSSVLRLDECVAVGGRFTCVRCGDAFCGIGENVCNCPLDCQWRPPGDSTNDVP